MKKIVTGCFLLLLSFQVNAQSDYAATWTLSGLDFGTEADDELLLDIDTTTRFAKANGVVLTDEGDAFAASGTCYFTAGNSLVCNLTFAFYSIEIGLDLADGSGFAVLIDYDGFFLDDGTLELTSVE